MTVITFMVSAFKQVFGKQKVEGKLYRACELKTLDGEAVACAGCPLRDVCEKHVNDIDLFKAIVLLALLAGLVLLGAYCETLIGKGGF